MSKKTESTVNEFECPGCKERLPIGSRKCKWCGTYITTPPEPIGEPAPEKKSFLSRVFGKK